MELVRDVLDKAIIDRNGRDMGRVDRIVVERRTGSPPRVVAIEVGASSLAGRLSRALGRWMTGVLHGLAVDEGQPFRIDVREILGITDTVKVDHAFGDTPTAAVERKARGFVGRIPGAHR